MAELRRRLAVPVRIDGQPALSETRFAILGAWSLHISTCLPVHGIELHSAYLGAPDADTKAQHLTLAPNTPVHSWQASHAEHAIPVWNAPGRCLLDHLALLTEHLVELGHHPEIDAGDQALAQLAA